MNTVKVFCKRVWRFVRILMRVLIVSWFQSCGVPPPLYDNKSDFFMKEDHPDIKLRLEEPTAPLPYPLAPPPLPRIIPVKPVKTGKAGFFDNLKYFLKRGRVKKKSDPDIIKWER